MACSKCGENNPENAKFCNACGAPMVSPASETPPSVPQKKFHVSKTFLLVAALVLAVVILFFAVLSVRNLIRRESYVTREDVILLHYRPEADRTLVDYNGKILDALIEGDVKVGVRSFHSLNTSDDEDDILQDVYTSKDGKNFKRVVEGVG